MRLISFGALLVASLTTTFASADIVDCININKDISLIEKLAKSGQYRELPKVKTTLIFDFNESRSYLEYLAYAKAKVELENPKASLKCPIETAVTKQSNKSITELTIADLVSPFELEAENQTNAILLIHGLTDSPFLFHDVAAYYHAQGFNVRTLLLPGHGTAPEALIDIDYQAWQQAASFAITRTLADFENVYLGGFSTGAALILDNLLSTNQDINKLNGVVLWAPASKAKSSVAWAAQVADWIPFLDYAHKGADIDFAKYESFPLNAGAQVHTLMNKLNDKLVQASHVPDVPLLVITSEVDSTIETQSTLKLMKSWHQGSGRKTANQDTLFYFGQPASVSSLPDSITRIFPKCQHNSYCEKILNVAHTSVTNAPSNPHYGWQGSYRNCETAWGSPHYKTCKTTQAITLGETTEQNLATYPHLQRLTFNPNFDQMTQIIADFVSKTQ